MTHIWIEKAKVEQALEALKGYRRELNDNQPCDAEKLLEKTIATEESSATQEQKLLDALKWIASHDLSGADDRAIALMSYAFVSKARFAVLEAKGERV